MLDIFKKKRNSQFIINSDWFWNHSDIKEEHKNHIKDVYRLNENEKHFSVLDFWKLHDNVVIVQGIWHFEEPNTDLYTVLLSVSHKNSMDLPYIVSPWDHCDWLQHVVERGWSPLQWWFLNREDETKLFTTSCERHLNEIDWHLAGVKFSHLNKDVLHKIMQLNEKRNNTLKEQSFNSH